MSSIRPRPDGGKGPSFGSARSASTLIKVFKAVITLAIFSGVVGSLLFQPAAAADAELFETSRSTNQVNGSAAGRVFLSNGQNPTDLFEVDLSANEVSFLLAFGSASEIHAIAACPSGESLVAIGKNPAVVSSVDLTAAVPTETILGQLPAEFFDAVVQLSCAPDGTIFLTNTMTEELFTLDLLTCPACTPVLVGTVETMLGAGDVDVEGADIAFTPFGELFLLTNGDSRRLYRIDPSSGAATLIGPISTDTNNTGMTATADNRLVISSNDDHIYEVSQTDAFLTDLGLLTESGSLVNINNGDMASVAPPTCQPCKGKVTQLTLRYLGNSAGQVQVFQQVNGVDVLIFDALVMPGEPFTIDGMDSSGTLGIQIRVFVNDVLNAKIHTSCSQPIGPGLVRGNFVVIEGFSKKGGRLCSVAEPAERLFLSNGQNPTDLFEVDLSVNEVDRLLAFAFASEIHAIAVCPYGESLIAIGKDPPVVSSVDLSAPMPTETILGELPSGFTDAVVQLSCAPDGTIFLTNSMTEELFSLDLLTCPACTPFLVGTAETTFGESYPPVVDMDVDIEGADLAFTPTGELFLLTNGGTRRLHRIDATNGATVLTGAISTDINNTGMTATADGRLVISSNDDHLYEASRADAFLTDLGILTEAGSPLNINNGDMASVAPLICQACRGQANQLTLRYLGASAGQVQIFQEVDGADVLIFDELVTPGEPFTIDGIGMSRTLGEQIEVFVNGFLNATIHTGCSLPTGPGLAQGDFGLVEGFSRNGGLLCPVPDASQ